MSDINFSCTCCSGERTCACTCDIFTTQSGVSFPNLLSNAWRATVVATPYTPICDDVYPGCCASIARTYTVYGPGSCGGSQTLCCGGDFHGFLCPGQAGAANFCCGAVLSGESICYANPLTLDNCKTWVWQVNIQGGSCGNICSTRSCCGWYNVWRGPNMIYDNNLHCYKADGTFILSPFIPRFDFDGVLCCCDGFKACNMPPTITLTVDFGPFP